VTAMQTHHRVPSSCSVIEEAAHVVGSLDSPSFAETLKAYKYSAPSLSMLEQAYLERFWDLLANKVYPPWLAPNLITLAGGACDMAALGLTIWHSPGLGGEAPRWVYACCAALLLSYQSLDGSDGKQARRTRSGSALGELMDHGLDACVIAVIVAFVSDSVGFGWRSPTLWAGVFGAQWTFMLTNLTLLMTNKMEIGFIDVMELQTAMAAVLLITSCMGPQFWSSTITLPWSQTVVGVRTLLEVASFVGMAASLGRNGLSLLRNQRHRRLEGGMWLTQQLATCAAYTVVGVLSARRAAELPGADGDRAMVRLLLCCALCYGEMMARMLVLRLGGLALPTLPRSVGTMLVFRASLEMGGSAQMLAVGLALATHLSFFVPAAAAIARVLEIHPFRVRGAVHWYSLHGAKVA